MPIRPSLSRIHTGASFLANDEDVRLPVYVAAIRGHFLRVGDASLDGNRGGGYALHSLVYDVWQGLLPGLGQLWFRTYHTWRNVWPYRLIQLVLIPSADSGERRRVATDLLRAHDCCIDAGHRSLY